MAAAFAALVSLANLIQQIQLYHARQPIFVEKQLRLIQCIQKKVSFLHDFLESYHLEVGDMKMSPIAYTAYAAEDILESYMVDDIHSRSINNKKRNPEHLSTELKKVAGDMDFVLEWVKMIKEKSGIGNHLPHVSSSKPPHPREKDIMVGFDEDLNKLRDLLTRGQQPNLQVIPITGMGGIGKTTLAQSIYCNPHTMQYFDVRGWVTVSQEYDVQRVFSNLLVEIGALKDQSNLEYHELGDKLHKHLSGRRYLVIIDDMWDLKAYEELKLFLPDNYNGSWIMVTTRLSNVANNVSSSDLHKMKLLDENKSWDLLCTKVFRRGSCLPELEGIGKTIARKCGGLPLSLAVIGGILEKHLTVEYWEYVSQNISTNANSEDDELCLKILSLSYRHLPVHLKPCFLYMGVFPEDKEIEIFFLIRLWVAEGFLKPQKGKSLEEVAKDYLDDLIDRNLVIVSNKLGYTGKVRFCKIHDLLRDLCMREALKERFLYCSLADNLDKDIYCQRRIAIHCPASQDRYPVEVCHALQSASSLRSLICDDSDFISPPSLNFRMLRILSMRCIPDDSLQLCNVRYMHFQTPISFRALNFPIHMFWNLQTLFCKSLVITLGVPCEIWKMQQLRHLHVQEVSLPDPEDAGMDEQDNSVLENLQTLSTVRNFTCTGNVVRMIPNIKELEMEMSPNSLYDLRLLHKLESLDLESGTNLHQNLEFPPSLKRLSLWFCEFDWEEITTKVGPLPNLESLMLNNCDMRGEFHPVEGHFRRLQFLKIESCDMKKWTADDTNFPCLEGLVFFWVEGLDEIPFGIGDIPTLQSIKLYRCSDWVVSSAKKIIEEQRSLGNENLHLQVINHLKEEGWD